MTCWELVRLCLSIVHFFKKLGSPTNILVQYEVRNDELSQILDKMQLSLAWTSNKHMTFHDSWKENSGMTKCIRPIPMSMRRECNRIDRKQWGDRMATRSTPTRHAIGMAIACIMGISTKRKVNLNIRQDTCLVEWQSLTPRSLVVSQPLLSDIKLTSHTR